MVPSARVRRLILSYHPCIPLSARLHHLHRFSPLPKSSQPTRVVSNADLYDFEISAEDMAKIDALDQGKKGAISWNPVDAD